MAPAAKGIAASRYGFMEAYNLQRFESENQIDAQGPVGAAQAREDLPRRVMSGRQLKRLLPWSSALLESGTPGTCGPWTGGRPVGGQAGYSLIRSDIEEDNHNQGAELSDGRVLPQMPHHYGAVRQRTAQHLGRHPEVFAHNPQDGLLGWVEAGWFQGISGLVIFGNAIIVGLETDIDTPLWYYFEQALLIFFTFELVVRMLKHGCNFFKHEDDWAWNLFDFSIVVSGVFDQWMVPLLEKNAHGLMSKDQRKKGKMSVVILLMRMARLLRIVRLFRLVRIVRPLYSLAQGVLEALQGMFWVLVFMVMTLYSVAILCTYLIGRGDIFSAEMLSDPDIQEIQRMFGTVDQSMFTLFGTMSSWSLVKFEPLFADMPILRPLFVLFYIYSAWALLAVMTGVVSENMIAIREQMLREDEQREEMRKMMVTQTLIDLFREADTDQSGHVSRQEFDAMLRSQELMRKIQKNTNMKAQDLQDLFDWLDHDGGGTITIDEFMMGFKWINEPLRAKSLVKLQERLCGDIRRLEGNVTKVVEQRVGEIQKLVTGPLRKVHAITEQMQNVDLHFGEIRTGVREHVLSMPTQEELRDMESRLAEKLAVVHRQLDEIERAAHIPSHE